MNDTLGFIETRGLTSLIEAVDVMLKTEDVEFLGYEKIGGGLVTAIIQGDIVAVKNAIEAGSASAKRIGEVISTHIIPKPHPELKKISALLK